MVIRERFMDRLTTTFREEEAVNVRAIKYSITPDQTRKFQQLMKQAREDRGVNPRTGRRYTQDEIGELAGVSQALISSLERGPYDGMRFLDFLKVLDFYKITPNEVARTLGFPFEEYKEDYIIPEELRRIYYRLDPDKQKHAQEMIRVVLEGYAARER